jgi:hypothetical protein
LEKQETKKSVQIFISKIQIFTEEMQICITEKQIFVTEIKFFQLSTSFHYSTAKQMSGKVLFFSGHKAFVWLWNSGMMWINGNG